MDGFQIDGLQVVSSIVGGCILGYVSHEIAKERIETTIGLGLCGMIIRASGVFGVLLGQHVSTLLFPKKWFQSDYNKLMAVYDMGFALLCGGIGILLERSLIGYWL